MTKDQNKMKDEDTQMKRRLTESHSLRIIEPKI